MNNMEYILKHEGKYKFSKSWLMDTILKRNYDYKYRLEYERVKINQYAKVDNMQMKLHTRAYKKVSSEYRQWLDQEAKQDYNPFDNIAGGY